MSRLEDAQLLFICESSATSERQTFCPPPEQIERTEAGLGCVLLSSVPVKNSCSHAAKGQENQLCLPSGDR